MSLIEQWIKAFDNISDAPEKYKKQLAEIIMATHLDKANIVIQMSGEDDVTLGGFYKELTKMYVMMDLADESYDGKILIEELKNDPETKEFFPKGLLQKILSALKESRDELQQLLRRTQNGN